MKRKVRAGIIGAGFIGGVHAKAVRLADGVVAAVADSTPEKSAAAASRLGAERAEATGSSLIAASDIDVVHICTPTVTHAALAEAAIRAGKHVVCEKPLATTVEDARRLTGLASDAEVVAAVPFVYRFYPTVREVRSRLAAEDGGRLTLLHGSYLQDWLSTKQDNNWRVDATVGGESRAFGDIGVHWCDLLEFTTGHRITKVTARMLTVYATRDRGADATTGEERVTTEDGAVLLFETDRGAFGSAVVSQVSPGRKNRLWFSWDGLDTSYEFDQQLPETLWIGSRGASALLSRGVDSLSPDAARYVHLPAGHPQGYQDCFAAFITDTYAAIGGEKPDGLPTFPDGLRAAVITAAVVKSAQTQTWVEVASCDLAS